MRQIGNYIVEDIPLGSGGMGQVLRGTSPQGVPVAIKEILPTFVSDIEYRSRIESEVNFLKKVNNPNVVRVYDFFELNGNIYIVMELVEGLNIEQQIIQHGAMPWQDAARIMVKILDTMQDVHEHGIVHRDIKPGNIMIRPNGEICLLDFGVAKDVSKQGGSGRTVVGTIIGTDGYMSPEQAEGLSIDHRSDVYALGCVLYFMLTGQHAFGHAAGSEYSMAMAITRSEFPRLAASVKGLPNSLQTVLDHATDKNMMRRYQSCREFSGDLARVIPGGTQINTSNRSGDSTLTIGRENCDLCVFPTNYKVSRHHADVKKKLFTGGEFFVYTDCSSNGTMINGQMLHRGMSYNIPVGQTPEILLAGDPTCRLDIREVADAFTRMEAPSADPSQSSGVQPSGSAHAPGFPPPGHGGYNPNPGGYGPGAGGFGPRRQSRNDSSSFMGAVKTCFAKYATFSGRASRAEFWWFVLFNFIIGVILGSFGVIMALSTYQTSWFFVADIYELAILLPSLAVLVRRFHDTNRSAWNLCWAFLPLIGGIIQLVYVCQKGTPGPNKYGHPE